MKSVKVSFSLFVAIGVFIWTSCCNYEAKSERPCQCSEKILAQLYETTNNYVFVAAHRGDWRNAPENSIQALKNAIEMGVDIMELDLKKTKDGHLIIMHDNTVDRTTNGTGNPANYTLDEIKELRLKNGLGRVTHHSIPTLREMLLVAKGKILIDIDKGYKYYPEVIRELKKTGTMNQIIYNIAPNVSYDSVISCYDKLEEDILIMPVINFSLPDAKFVLDSYTQHKNTIYQPIFDKDDYGLVNEILELHKDGNQVWINSMWASLNGGHDDDRALEDPDGSWGWLIDHGASIIQTDRPALLLEYLRGKELHN